MLNDPQGELRQRLLAEMESLRTVDCHSHTATRRAYYAENPLDLFTLVSSYYARDIHSTTGRTWDDLRGEARSDAERWAILKWILARSRNVSYWRHNLVVFRGLFGLEETELNDGNWEAVNAAIRERSADPGWYDYVTREVCGLKTQVRNVSWFEEWEPEYFTPILRMEGVLDACGAASRGKLEQQMGRAIGDIGAMKLSVAELLQSYVKQGVVGIKLGHAYGRTLATEDVSEEDAGRVFAWALVGGAPSAVEIRAFQDHMIRYMAGLCADMGLVFQIHTGVQSNWGYIPNSDPLLLLPLIHAYRSTRFDLFHAGYPYSREMGMLGKHCPNVWLNMCWMYVITMEGSRQTLSEWIDLVPAERLLGFGSDVRSPELIYGHLVMARSCIADVLAEKVERDFLSEEAAMDLVRMMIRENGMRLYGLSESGRNP